MSSNWFWLASGAVGGWLASQFGVLLKDVLRRWWLKRAIVSELRQVYEEAGRIWVSLSRSLQMYSLGGLDPGLPLPLSNRVFVANYDDAQLIFTRVQRVTMILVHEYVGQVNAGIADLILRTNRIGDAIADGEECAGDWERYGSKLRAVMRNVAEVRWMSNYYLRHSDFPVLEDDGEEIEDYRRFRDSAAAELEKIIASVRGLELDDFKSSVPKERKPPPDSSEVHQG